MRNEILYASTGGIFEIISGLTEELERYYKTVFRLIIIYSLIYPYKNKKSPFIQNALNSYLSVMMDIKL